MAESRIVSDWLNLADEDFGFATSNLTDPETNYFSFICFHFQQAAEKYLKAYIVAKKLRFEKIHDLEVLRKICAKDNKLFKEIKEECIFLTDFYIEARYPAIWPTQYTRSEAEKAQKAVQKIKFLVESLLE
ncbi:HEPN domain-containing protein [Candidatus Gottesmanbacteria bacterium]|nr:HEPN domain-containing protein [Candidatus Gottesmanbacteria bacterium]